MKNQKVIAPGITKKELADLYGVDLRMLNGWLKEIGIITKKRLNPRQLYKMVKELYLPEGVTLTIVEPDFVVRERNISQRSSEQE
tara:strand:+ start:425 stop:679 length:255 start_codon:yes stop_codon:yes gene_type:complete